MTQRTPLVKNPPCRKKKLTEKISTNKSTMTNYTNCLTLEQMEYLDLFDEIPYKVVKKLVKLDDETDFEVEIKDIPIDGCCMCSTSFTFKLEINISQGSLPLMVEKEYCVIKEYNGSSPMAMFIGGNLVEEEEEESSEEEEEDERYCDNDDCPYGGFCCFEVLEEHKGKPYICEGCSTGIGLQEQEQQQEEEEEKCGCEDGHYCKLGLLCEKCATKLDCDNFNGRESFCCNDCEDEEEEEDDDSKCICGELHEACFNCVMCAEPIYQGNFSQNCVLCMNSMCMNCDEDERKFRGENICENCEEENLEESSEEEEEEKEELEPSQ